MREMRNFSIAVIGSGPAGLMAAYASASAGAKVTLFEKRPSAGRKLLVAGSSGLNITYDAPIDELLANYGKSSGRMESAVRAFSPQAWREFIHSLGISTFKGTSRRWFIEGMKAAPLLKNWLEKLSSLGVAFEYGKELSDFESTKSGVILRFQDGSSYPADAACLSLGGGSWEPQEKPLRWPAIFKAKGIEFEEFEASNVGFRVDWPEGLLKEAEGQPIKNVILSSSRGSRSGDLMITRYGLEGTPVYFAGEKGLIHLDLKPDLTEAEILKRVGSGKENLSPMRRVDRFLKLSAGAKALAYHLTSPDVHKDLKKLVARLKSFPIELQGPQSIDEAISSSGGVAWSELDEGLMLKKYPGVFLAGEMIDWDAPTGGFLIQGCVSQGAWTAKRMIEAIKKG